MIHEEFEDQIKARDTQIFEAERLLKIARLNHKNVVETKRITNERLKVAIAALQQIYDVCKDNAAPTCHHDMALNFVKQIACDAFEKATTEAPRKMWSEDED
jgi:hypothetical protein